MKFSLSSFFIMLIAVALLAVLFTYLMILKPFKDTLASQQHTVQNVQGGNLLNTVTASGDVEAQNQVTLSFLNPGRVAWVGVNEGDNVVAGQALAKLDTTIASHDVSAALQNYNSAQSALDKVLDDIHSYQYGNGGFANVGSANETQAQKTARQEAQAAVNVSYDNLQIAQKQLDLSTIVAPFDGKVLSIDDLAVGQNITAISPSSITVVGSEKLKFVANVEENDIGSFKLGQQVTINLAALPDKAILATVSKVPADKTSLSNGESVYKVDIQSQDLENIAKAGQGGEVIIKSQQSSQGTIVPSWTVLGGGFIWVLENGKPVLKKVTKGASNQDSTQILSGLSGQDQVILDPQMIVSYKYLIP